MNRRVLYLSAFLLTGSLLWGSTPVSQLQVVKKDNAAINQALKLFDSGDRQGAFQLLKPLENSGDLRVLSRLGWCYYSGSGAKENKDLAYQYFKRSLDDPDGFGIDGMGMCYQHGTGVEKDLQKAEQLHKKALAMGNLYAAGNLALCYDAIGNNDEAIRYWEMSYKSPLPPFWKAFSAHMLGLRHTDPKQKVFWWEEAARRGFHDALLELSRLYNFGDNVAINIPKALEYSQRYSEQTGTKEPYAAVAFDWAIEKMVLQDRTAAAKYMLIAADNGNPKAYWYAFQLSGDGKYALAAAESGDERGFAEAGVYLMTLRKKNPQSAQEYKQRAVKYYKAAIELQDSNSLNAMCNLAAAYAENSGKENIAKALTHYEEASRWHFARGLRGMGIIHLIFSRQKEFREEAKKKYALSAIENIAAAAFLGDKFAVNYCPTLSQFADKYKESAEAKFLKGVTLIIQTPQDKATPELRAQAIKLIKTAADGGCLQALMLLGTELEEDGKAAAEYLKKAAAKGNLHAKWLLASEMPYKNAISENDRLNCLKELIAVGNRNSRNLYAQLLAKQEKTAEAIKEFGTAAAQGHAGSMTLLHLLLLQQNNEKSMDEAMKLLTQAIEKHDGLAQCLAGLNTIDTPEFSPRFGMHLLMKGAIDGGGVSYYHWHCIAMNFAQGKGVAKSAENAKRIAEIMLEKGFSYGFYTMGQLCQMGAFGKADTAKAREYYRQGAKQGCSQCAEELKTSTFSK